MANVLPRDLTSVPDGEVNPNSAVIVDDGSGVFKSTPAQLVASGFPIASQSEAEAGAVNNKAMTPQRVAQAIDALGVSQAVLASSTGAEMVGFRQDDPDAVDGTVEAELRNRITVTQFGADPTGAADSTSAFADARSKGNRRYVIPPGTYIVNDDDVWMDSFSTPYGEVILKVNGTDYNVSHSLGGKFRTDIVSNDRYLWFRNAKTGTTLLRLSDAENSGDVNIVAMPFEFRRDSHSIISCCGTPTGNTDITFARSIDDPDPRGNRTLLGYSGLTDEFYWAYASTASGAPNFLYAIIVKNGTSPTLKFPYLAAEMQAGYILQTRTGGALRTKMTTGNTEHVYSDLTTSNTLSKTSRTRMQFAGVSFNTLYDTPFARKGAQRFGGVFSDLAGSDPDVLGTLPATKKLWNSTTGRVSVCGRMTVTAASNTGSRGLREARFTWDGSTLTVTDIENTLDPAFTADIALNGSDLEFQAAYAGGVGTGYALSVDIEWNGAGR
ncbi:hypothetical protein [Sphingopyxis sp. 113P3]|uniref:hypothetical protein n=1 Tax=Sphingopyxis sp. (strain 113P3) TaxID=292913 RepID=UPI0006AD4806|nr:hypothetical protein [Sphingopyxis sp. 113P3]ALC11204.1 hypothetical protein LH20_04485 [Sphingopyxis sp. 113P3]